MYVSAFRVENFRRLKDVRVDMEDQQTIFVGANNSGKTSATYIFQMFLGANKGKFQIYDFTADCWEHFNDFASEKAGVAPPSITFDLWFEVDDANVHRVVDLLPDLSWSGEPVGIRMVYAARDLIRLRENYREAQAKSKPPEDVDAHDYAPWPVDMVDYLTRRLRQEYDISYYVLDRSQCNDDLKPVEGYEPFLLGTATSGASNYIDAILRVDFLDAQRHLSDADSRGRSEDLSKRLSRFYQTNLEKRQDDFEALSVIANSEQRLNSHFAKVFKPTLDQLAELGYPGVSNPGLVVKASFDAYGILSTSAQVHYALLSTNDPSDDGTNPTLPDQYNGLGFKNLIYMVVEVLDCHQSWSESSGDRPPVHLIMIEEPEAHLHAQLQQVFIRKILNILPSSGTAFQTQMVVTTHSPHIIYESSFKPIRYFLRSPVVDDVHCSEVRNLSTFYKNEEPTTRAFLQQYLKLTHCDLFFADAAVLVEGNVERLLLPLMIAKDVEELRGCHLTILEVGGAFAHKFRELIDFLGLTTLVITDLDSVNPAVGAEDEEIDEEGEPDDAPVKGAACPVMTVGAVSANQTLRQWLPGLTGIEELLDAGDELKLSSNDDGNAGQARVTYQTLQPATWKGETAELAARTLEEAIAMENLEWTQATAQKGLHLRITGADSKSLSQMHKAIYTRVKNFDKTDFALNLMMATPQEWTTPRYILDGLEWLSGRLLPVAAPDLPSNVPEEEK